MRVLCGAVLLGIAGWRLLSPAVTSAQQERVLPYRNDVPIAQRLLPDDRVVTVKRTESTHGLELTRGATLEEWVPRTVGASEAAALVTVTEITPHLVDQGTWLETGVQVGIEALIFSDVPDLYRGAHIAIHHRWGGVTTIRDVLVKAGVPLNVARGSTYLVFMTRDPDVAGRWFLQSTMLAVEDERLVDTWRHLKRAGIRDPLDGVALSRAIGLIREEAEKKQRRRRER